MTASLDATQILPPKQARSRDTLDRILAAAREVLEAKNFEQATLSEVVERAGVDKSEVSETILGQVLTAAQGQNPARNEAAEMGLPGKLAVENPPHDHIHQQQEPRGAGNRPEGLTQGETIYVAPGQQATGEAKKRA